MNKAEFSQVLSLTQEDVITIYAPGLADAGPYGWVDFVELKETDKTLRRFLRQRQRLHWKPRMSIPMNWKLTDRLRM